ncbi:MAG: DUF411 domain-containing protein [Candidatus Paceibacterota bacterium]
MKTSASIIAVGIGLVVVASVGYALLSTPVESSTLPRVTVHKTPQCGCCEVYISYLRQYGIEVVVKDHEDLTPLKNSLSIPSEMWSCHTTMIGEFIAEGHLPIEALEKGYEERSEIAGIALPGMPSGSPGMPGPKEDFKINSLSESNDEGVRNYQLWLTL